MLGKGLASPPGRVCSPAVQRLPGAPGELRMTRMGLIIT